MVKPGRRNGPFPKAVIMPRRFLAPFLLLLAACLLSAASAALPRAAPESVGMSSERLERIAPRLEGMVENRQVAGFITLVARKGKVVHYRATGSRGLSAREAMPLNAIFDIASMTKPLTAVAALMLYEEGRIALDDRIAEHLPEFQNLAAPANDGKPAPAQREVSVRHLFTHASGMKHPRNRAEKYASPRWRPTCKTSPNCPCRRSRARNGFTAIPSTCSATWSSAYPGNGSTASCSSAYSTRWA